jgi:hypothetical protein
VLAASFLSFTASSFELLTDPLLPPTASQNAARDGVNGVTVGVAVPEVLEAESLLFVESFLVAVSAFEEGVWAVTAVMAPASVSALLDVLTVAIRIVSSDVLPGES